MKAAWPVSTRHPSGHVLVVDPDDGVCAFLKDALEAELRIEVSTVRDAPTAHRRLQESEIDLVLVDSVLPGAPGRLAVTAHAGKLRIPVIVMTTTAQRSVAGPAVLEKPFRVAALTHIVHAKITFARTPHYRLPVYGFPSPQTRH